MLTLLSVFKNGEWDKIHLAGRITSQTNSLQNKHKDHISTNSYCHVTPVTVHL